MKKILIALTMLVYASGVQAVCNSTGCIGVGEQVVTILYPNHTGNVYIGGPVDRANLNCTLVEGAYMVLKGGTSGHPLFKELYSAILSGMMAGKKMHIRITEGTPDCEVTYVMLWN